MDNLTHTLTAVALSQAGLNRKTRFATLALVLASNLPDIDLAIRFAGNATRFKYHRSYTESILGVIVLAALLAGAVYFFGRKAAPRRSGPPLDGRWLFGICCIATATHLLMDFADSDGVRPFLPFSRRWYAWDIMFTFDLLLLTLLAIGLGLPAILHLVSEEVGAKKTGLRWGALFCLAALVLLLGLRDFAHRRVLGLMEGHTYSGQDPQRLGAFPSPANPFEWTGVVETDSAYYVLPANALDPDVNPEDAGVFRKPEPSPALEAALKTHTAVIFSDFARFPWAQVRESEAGFAVSIRDLRYFSDVKRQRSFVVDVELDKDLRVRSETLSFSAPTRKGEF